MTHPKITFKRNTFLLELGYTRNMGLTPPIKTLVPKKRWDVRDIPADSRMCVHVEVEVDPTDDQVITKVNRCTFPSVRRGPNGFLCSYHQDILNHRVKVPYVNLDDLIIEDILVCDARAIKAGTIVKMRPPHSVTHLRSLE